MENNLYRIEVVAWDNLPSIDTMGMLYTNEGIAFVKLHPVKLTVKPKSKDTHGKWVWKRLYEDDAYQTLVCSECMSADGASDLYKYCPNCGTPMDGGVDE